ncbi:probable N-acetyltransferase HLS1 [Aristolochia californica]|uniref:probable N-acetyltransferase HLS1 n=1 Tax=Aristolochia californica TaxID=171875 RepID=UPI0035DB5DA7
MGEERITVREYAEQRDWGAVEELEKRCQVGPSGKVSLYTDCMGDPLSRVRHSPAFLMLVAEYGEGREIVGVIRGSIRTVTTGRKQPNTDSPLFTKVAYILGLRVSPLHRRLGIATKLVQKLEAWCKQQQGVEYAYMATDCSNEASINLFTLNCAYLKFRTPAILVHPVHVHRVPVDPDVAVVPLAPSLADSIYRRAFSTSEFFPKDIDAVLSSKLTLGTFLALPKSWIPVWDPLKGVLPPSLAILSVWNTKEVYKLQVKGASTLTKSWCAWSRVLDTCMPCMRIPSVPDFFRPFGVYLMYGLHMEGKAGAGLMRALCAFVHNMARADPDCGAVVTEVGMLDPVREAVPHWKRFSWEEDIWCMKRLVGQEDVDVGGHSDWPRSRPSSSVLFVDPRDF